MLKPLAKTAAALSLILSASFSMPALAGSSVDGRKCTGVKHQQSKRVVVAAPARKAAPAQGATIVEKRKLDVQILSFGP